MSPVRSQPKSSTSLFPQLFFVATVDILFVLHGIEETVLGITNVDPFLRRCGKYALDVLWGEILLFVLLVSISPLIPAGRLRNVIRTIIGGVLLFESDHIIRSVLAQGYYPGVVTGIAILILGLYYLYHFIRNLRSYSK